AETKVAAILFESELISKAAAGQEVQIVLEETPFYAESGGQIADEGTIANARVKAAVRDVQKAPNGQHLHTVHIQEGTLSVGDTIVAEVNRNNRSHIVKNHTATHLLHQALKD